MLKHFTQACVDTVKKPWNVHWRSNPNSIPRPEKSLSNWTKFAWTMLSPNMETSYIPKKRNYNRWQPQSFGAPRSDPAPPVVIRLPHNDPAPPIDPAPGESYPRAPLVTPLSTTTSYTVGCSRNATLLILHLTFLRDCREWFSDINTALYSSQSHRYTRDCAPNFHAKVTHIG